MPDFERLEPRGPNDPPPPGEEPWVREMYNILMADNDAVLWIADPPEGRLSWKKDGPFDPLRRLIWNNAPGRKISLAFRQNGGRDGTEITLARRLNGPAPR